VHFNEFEVWSRAAAATFFLFLTAPAAAHLIGRAGYIEGVALFGRTHTDELAGRYCKDSKVLRSEPDPSGAPDSSEARGAGRGSGSAD
jgi:multicomponent Na+:H+ antiporter subunit G